MDWHFIDMQHKVSMNDEINRAVYDRASRPMKNDMDPVTPSVIK